MIAAFELGAPAWLLLWLCLPALWWFERARDRRAQALRRELLGPRAAALVVGSVLARPSARWCGLGAFAALALALSDPRWGEPRAQTEARGLDLVVCLDVSRSMLARDVPPNRLEAAKAMVAALAHRARGDRLGLVAFAGSARLCVPLCSDAESFVQLLAQTDELSVVRGGTDLGAAIDTALAALVGGTGGGTLLLLTDGEDHGGQGLLAARRCAAQGIPVHCVGFGSERGGKIPIASGGGETFLRAGDGRDVVSVLDRAGLTAMAAAAGGQFVEAATAGERALVALYEERVLPAARTRLQASGELAPPGRFQWPLAIAIALWLLQLALAGQRGERVVAARR